MRGPSGGGDEGGGARVPAVEGPRGQETERLAGARPVDPEAHDAYLKGSFYWKQLTLEGQDTAQRYFELALEKDPNYILVVAEKQNYLVGSAMGIICEELYGVCNPFMVVEDVIVDRYQRRLGIASALMKELESFAVNHDCNYIIFVTESERKDAHRFYQSLGYKSDAYKGFKKRL